MSNAHRILFPLASVLLAGCTASPSVSPVAREFLRVPDHYVGNLSRADRRYWVDVTRGNTNVINDRNLDFSYDGEEDLSGEGPLAFHLFRSGACPTVGIFIERFYDKSTRIPPATSLFILTYEHGHWMDITREALPKPFDPRLYYEFSPSADTLSVRAYTHSDKGYITPGRGLYVWQWTGRSFTPTQQ